MTLAFARYFPVVAFSFATFICSGQTVVSVASVQNGASFTSKITPGAFVTIKGTGFTSAALSSNTVPVPNILGGVSVTVAGLPCPIYFVNPTQINFLLPWKTPVGSYPLTVTANGQTVGPLTILVTAEAPGIFQYGANRAVAQNVSDGYSLNGPGAPAAVASTIVVYVTGVGLISNPPADGAYTPTSPFSQAVYANSATLGGVTAPVTFIGLTPGLVGLAQANITIPILPSGDYPLTLTIAGFQSTSALISVAGTGTGLPLILSPLGSVLAPTTALVAPIQTGGRSTAANVVVSGNYAYLCDANGIAIIDVTNASAPKLLSTFGQSDLNAGGAGCALYQGDLLAFTSALLFTYDLTIPTSPQRLGLNQFQAGNSRFLSATKAYTTKQSYLYDSDSYEIVSQTGEFYVYDMSNPAQPKLNSQLAQNFSQPGSANTSPRLGVTVFNDQTAIVLGTTATGSNTAGQGLWTTIDVSTPTKPSVLGQTMIPGAAIATRIATQGNLALIAGNSGGYHNPELLDPITNTLVNALTGNVTLNTVDFSNPLNGMFLGSLTTPYQSIKGTDLISLGKGFFYISIPGPITDLQAPGMLAIVDARNPASLAVYPEYVIDGLQGTFVLNGKLYAVTGSGLNTYSITLP